MAETDLVLEWRIQNLSHWCAEVHGHCIQSPRCHTGYFSNMELYPKGISGQGEHLVVQLCNIKYSYTGELSFCSSDGSLLCSKQQVYADVNKHLELPPGPKFEDVLSRIRESEDFITVTLRVNESYYYKQCMRTVINALKISVKINSKGIENIKLGIYTNHVCQFYFSPNNYHGMELETCSENDIVHFMIEPLNTSEYPFAVEMCMSLTRSDDTVSCVKKEHMFHDDSPWRFHDAMKKELDGKGISIFLCLKTKNVIQIPSYGNHDYSNVSIELNNTSCSSEKAPSMDPLTSDELLVLTKDSGIQTFLTSDTPDDSVQVLLKELMCLYQDQKFSDIRLKCKNVTFPVHGAILSARSPVFDRLLSSDMREAASGTVDIEDLDPSTLSRFLTYLYTGVVEDLQDDSALKLYYAADKYQIPSLKRHCSKFLCANVSVSNVCDTLSLGDRHQDEELTAASHDFILDNFNTVLKSKEWDTLKKNEPVLVADTVTQFAVEGRVGKNPPQ